MILDKKNNVQDEDSNVNYAIFIYTAFWHASFVEFTE